MLVRFSLTVAAFLASATAQTVDFTRDVKPVFEKKCAGCHGAALQMNGLRLDNSEDALRGGYSGPAIVKGNSASSKLIERVSSSKEGFRMPPAGPALTAAEITTLRAWIDNGAPWPATARTPAAAPKSTHWAFQPIRRPAPPAVTNAAWVRNPIDAFVLARLEKEGIAPSPEASKEILLRRLSLDLTGLPPSPQEVGEFVNDQRPDAYERQVDRLLASPHYGEKWARPWLDLAHYADSDGYEKDQVRPYAWRWRQWVIEALNRDLPFDQFTIQQLAGDLLPDRTAGPWIATGFLRNTLTNREAGVDREEARFEQVVNRANTVGTTWLGLTVGCAQCHDHKYDPISQKDYYQLFAFFNTADEETVDAPLPGEVGPYLAALPEYNKQRAALLAEHHVPELFPQWEKKMRQAIDHPGSSPEWDFSLTSMRAMFDNAVKVLKRDAAQRTPEQQRRLIDYFINRPTTFGFDKEKSTRLRELREKLAKFDRSFPELAQAPVMVEDHEAGPTHLHVKGDWRQKGIAVEKNTPSVLPPLNASKPDRLALARWLVSNDNPLTARVQVNRAWQELFGRGIARTSEDFGKMGEKPSHPELLDWLAAGFMDDWSVKRLHKTIVMSAAYRQSSHARKELESRDPDNALLARQSRLRLSAEVVRDSALAAADLLDTAIGGRSVRPPQPAGVAELGYSGGTKWAPSEGRERYRRGLYIHFQRTTPYPMLMNFDAPDSNVSCSRRTRSNTPLQALNLLNDVVFFEAARAMAWRIEREAPAALGERLDYAFRLAVGRKPTESERQRLAQYHDQQARIFQKEGSSVSPWVGVARVLLNLDEFITRD